MRVSIDRRDPGYRWNASSYHVRFNGEEVPYVVTADEERGMVVRYVLEDGKPKVAPDGEHWVLETVEGTVEVFAKNAAGEDVRLPKVKVERNASGVIEVLVYSRVKPGAIRRSTIDEKTLDYKRTTVASAVNITAGAAAEHLIATLGDVFEPSDVAMLATEEYDRLMRTEQAVH